MLEIETSDRYEIVSFRQPIKKPCNWCVSRSIAQLWITETSSCRHRRELPVRVVVRTAKHEGWQVPRKGSVVYGRCAISSNGLMLEPKRLLDAWFCSSWLSGR